VTRLPLTFLLFALTSHITATYAQEAEQDVAPEFVPQMGPDRSCARVAFSPDSRLIVTSGRFGEGELYAGEVMPGTLQVWETATGRLVRNIRLDLALYSSYLFEDGQPAISPDGKYFALFAPPQAGAAATAATSPPIEQWQTPLVWELSTGRAMIHSDWTMDLSQQALVNKDVPWTSKEIESWRTPQSDEATKWAAQRHPDSEEGMPFLESWSAFSPGKKYLAQVYGFGHLWEVQKEREIPGFCSSQVLLWKGISLSGDGKLMAAASTGRVQLSSDDPQFIPGNWSRIVVWDLQNASGPRHADVRGRLQSITLSPDAKRIGTGTREDDMDTKGRLELEGFTALWDQASLAENADKEYSDGMEYSETTSTVAFSRDGSRFASAMITRDAKTTGDSGGGYRGLLKIWNAETGKLLWKRSLPDPELSAAAFSPDGKTVATGHSGVLVKLYDAVSSSRIRFFDDKQADTKGPFGADSAVLSLAFSPDGALLVAGNSVGHLHIWQAQTGKLVAHLSEPTVNIYPRTMYEFGASSEATGGKRSSATGESVEAVVFSEDGKRLYSAGCSGTIKVWDTATWKQISSLVPSEDRCIRALVLSPDGKWLISAGEDGQILFWDTASNRLSARLLVGVDGKQWLVVTGDGHFDGTDDGVRSLAVWRIGNRLVSLDSLPTAFRVKGLLQKVLSRQALSGQLNLSAVLSKP